MMNYKVVDTLLSLNPYNFTRAIKNREIFADRKLELEYFKNKINQAVHMNNWQNILILGRRGIGKTSLLNMYEDILRNNKFLVSRINLNREMVMDTFSFFKNILFSLIEEGAKNGILSYSETMILLQILEGKDIEDKIVSSISDIYAPIFIAFSEFIRSIIKILSIKKSDLPFYYADIQKYFIKLCKYIIEKCLQKNFYGISILIDNGENLVNNVSIIEILRNVTEELDNLFLIIASTEVLIDKSHEYPSFIRSCDKLFLHNFKEVSEVEEAVIKPLRSVENELKKRKIDFVFKPPDCEEIKYITNGNPYEIQLLMYYSYEHNVKQHFYSRKSSREITLTLNRDIFKKSSIQLKGYRNYVDFINSLDNDEKIYLTIIASSGGYASLNELSLLEYRQLNLRDLLLQNYPIEERVMQEFLRKKIEIEENILKIFDSIQNKAEKYGIEGLNFYDKIIKGNKRIKLFVLNDNYLLSFFKYSYSDIIVEKFASMLPLLKYNLKRKDIFVFSDIVEILMYYIFMIIYDSVIKSYEKKIQIRTKRRKRTVLLQNFIIADIKYKRLLDLTDLELSEKFHGIRLRYLLEHDLNPYSQDIIDKLRIKLENSLKILEKLGILENYSCNISCEEVVNEAMKEKICPYCGYTEIAIDTETGRIICRRCGTILLEFH